MNGKGRALAAALAMMLALGGCMARSGEGPTWQLNGADQGAPKLPEGLEIGEEGLPMLKVWDTASETVMEMDIE